jgi:phosphonate degradation associated HDIG domain protein
MHLNFIREILIERGQQQYGGEAISQLEHALQCATLAQINRASNELIIACLLHDFGHLVDSDSDEKAVNQIDNRHEYRAIAFLQTIFPAAVTEPIRLHVEAKQYLCAVNPTYWANLSPASQHSLKFQGGILSAEAVQQFATQPFAQDAIKLRLWDDQAKVVGAQTPNLESFMTLVRQ